MSLPQSLLQLWLLLFACFVVFLQKLQVNTDFFSLPLRSKSSLQWVYRCYFPLQFTTKFSQILIGLINWNWLRDAIVFIRGETLSAHTCSAHPPKIPGWRVVVRENCPVNKRIYKKKIEIVFRKFCLLSFSNFTFGFHGFHLKKAENNSTDSWTRVQKKI